MTKKFLELRYELDQDSADIPESTGKPSDIIGWVQELQQKAIQKKANKARLSSPRRAFGEVFETILNKQPVYFMLAADLRNWQQEWGPQRESLAPVLKVSPAVEYATQYDYIFTMNGQRYMLQTWNLFYLTEWEINTSLYLGCLNVEDTRLLQTQVQLEHLVLGQTERTSGILSPAGELRQRPQVHIDKPVVLELPEHKRGLSVPVGDYRYIQNRFQRDEASIVLSYHLRGFPMEEHKPELKIPANLFGELRDKLVAMHAKDSERNTAAHKENIFTLKETATPHHILMTLHVNWTTSQIRILFAGETCYEGEFVEQLTLAFPALQNKEKLNLTVLAQHLTVERIL